VLREKAESEPSPAYQIGKGAFLSQQLDLLVIPSRCFALAEKSG
jgi:hypothetical protein